MERGHVAVEDNLDARAEAILDQCGAMARARRDLLRLLARQAASLEADLEGHSVHDADYLRVLKGYEDALKALKSIR